MAWYQILVWYFAGRAKIARLLLSSSKPVVSRAVVEGASNCCGLHASNSSFNAAHENIAHQAMILAVQELSSCILQNTNQGISEYFKSCMFPPTCGNLHTGAALAVMVVSLILEVAGPQAISSPTTSPEVLIGRCTECVLLLDRVWDIHLGSQ